jgi:hypothetical protein
MSSEESLAFIYVEPHSADRELPFFKQIGLIPPELMQLIKATAGMLAATRVERV